MIWRRNPVTRNWLGLPEDQNVHSYLAIPEGRSRHPMVWDLYKYMNAGGGVDRLGTFPTLRECKAKAEELEAQV